ncbi:MAG: hypothetical protein AAF417_19915 [Pseudomonadota bacterium]
MVLAQEIILDSDTDFVFPQDLRDRLPEPASQREADTVLGSRPEENLVIKIRDIRNVSGNNFLNQEQPVLNFNGRVLTSVDDLVLALQGSDANDDDNSTGLSACVGSINFGTSATSPADFRFAGIQIDPNTLSCALRNDGKGNALIFQNPPGTAPQLCTQGIGVFPDRLVGTFEFTAPSAVVTEVVAATGALTTLFVRATNGTEVRIQFTVNQTGACVAAGGEFQLVVSSVTKVN